jgi:uncharacterized protein (DUF1684 family)
MADTHNAGSYLDLFNYRQQVFEMYRQRNKALENGANAAAVLATFRTERDQLFAQHPQSALSPAERDRFTGLKYFPYDPTACVEAELEPDTRPAPVGVGTSHEDEIPMVRVATLRFTMSEWSGRLALYWIEVYGGGLFLPFRDATAPAETYGGGRYLFDTVKGSDFVWSTGSDGRRRMVLDFNYAYNPSCAYDHVWACPLGPRENWLSFPVRAGERKFEARS